MIYSEFGGRVGGMSGPGRQSLCRQDEGSALEKLQILREASEVIRFYPARSASRWEAAETLRAFRHPQSSANSKEIPNL